ncbi:paralemmin-1-like [Conger conger]|uniref:paralemmin-1-like n=1 Tax=Conger conger TaxID=82655 RepID=UPI002A59A1D2|nr:paralemmin-1-like [Conger conger]
MDEAEKYQQRLQAIAEKRRLQEEQERMKREVEDERLKLQQLKRKSLRDQWLMDTLPSTTDGPETDSPLQGPQTQGDAPQTGGPRLAEEELKDLADGCSQTHTDEHTQGVETPGGHTKHLQEGWTPEGVGGLRTDHHTQTASFNNGQEVRSVLGVVELQVERDLKTGATVILSVAPVAPNLAGAAGETVFDDGRRSVQAVGDTGAPPGPEELGQILDVLTGAGLQALLGDTKKGERSEERDNQEARREEEEEVQQEVQHTCAEENGFEVDTDVGSASTHNALQQEVTASPSASQERRESPQVGGAGKGGRHTEAEGWGGPVTMTFLGFAEVGPEEEGEVIRAERVIITEEGDEPPPGGAENPSVPPAPIANPTEESSTIPGCEASTTPHSEPCPVQGEDTPTAEGGAETLEPTPFRQSQGTEEQPPEDSTLRNTGEPSQLPPGTMATAPPPGIAQEEGGAEAEAQDISLGGTAQEEGRGVSEPQASKRVAGQQIPATPAELQPLVSVTKEAPLPSPDEGGDPPKHKSCQCCSVM